MSQKENRIIQMFHTYSSASADDLCNTVYSRCRLCASLDPTANVINDDLRSKIHSCVNLHIEAIEDPLPTNICKKCEGNLNTMWLFCKQVEKAQDELMTLINRSIKIEIDEQIISNIDEEIMVDCDLIYGILEEVVDPLQTSVTTDKIMEEFIDDNIFEKVLDMSIPKNTKPKKNKGILQGTKKCVLNSDGSLILKNVEQGWDNYPHICSECRWNFCNFEDLSEHFLKFHIKATKFTCADCLNTYSKFDVFLKHVHMHRPYLRFCCDVCSKWFPNSASHEKHRRTHENKSASITYIYRVK